MLVGEVRRGSLLIVVFFQSNFDASVINRRGQNRKASVVAVRSQ